MSGYFRSLPRDDSERFGQKRLTSTAFSPIIDYTLSNYHFTTRKWHEMINRENNFLHCVYSGLSWKMEAEDGGYYGK